MDEYSDDGFDDLNDNVLQELENKAIQLTQAQAPYQSQEEPTQPFPSPSAYAIGGFEDDDLDDAIVIDEAAQLPSTAAVHKPLPPQQARVVPGIAGQQARWPRTPQPAAPTSGRAPPPISSRPVPQPLPPPRRPPLDATQAVGPSSQRYPPRQPTQYNNRIGPPHNVPSSHGQASQYTQLDSARNPNDIIVALQARLSALTSELTSAKGEAAILRSKHDKAQINHDAEVTRLKKQNAEQLAKQERAVEAAAAAERHATTELQFTRQDLKEELDRAKSRRKDTGVTTPKKNKGWGGGDGFDDIEIFPSPSKAHGQRRRDPGPVAGNVTERTPTRGKRKRPAVDSPVMALETHDEDVAMVDDPRPAAAQPALMISSRNALPFDFLKLVLDHISSHGQPLTFDLFSRYSFPSKPSQTFASIIFETLPTLGNSQDPMHLLIDFSELVLDLWNRCIQEKYYSVIYDLVALLSYTLQLNTILVAPHIIPTLLPLAQMTCFLVAIPRFNHPTGDLTSHTDRTVQQLFSDIDVTQSLSLLFLTALSCLGPSSDTDFSSEELNVQDSSQVQFWKHMQLEFVLMMLSPKHPEQDFLGMLSLLCTSVLPDSVGPILNPSLTSVENPGTGRPDDMTPEFSARSIIDRVSFYLAEPPRWAPRRSAKECRVRLAVLRTLTAFAKSPFGALQIAKSALVIPRLVTVMSWAIDSLYDMDVPSNPSLWVEVNRDEEKMAGEASGGDQAQESTQTISGDGINCLLPHKTVLASVPQPRWRTQQAASHETIQVENNAESDTDRTMLLSTLIEQLTLLLHTLVTDPRTASAASPQTKLAALHGGSYRYQITLARLTFAEDDLVYERGISAETVDRAHELLELAVTPDEGEGIGEVFGP